MVSKLLRAKLNLVLRSTPDLLPAHAKILVAVSGGQDSLCLAKLLLILQPKWQWQIAIGHCDHQWRTDSIENALHVQQLATKWEVPFYLKTAIEPLKNEAVARAWRYQMLTTIAESTDCSIIVTGHTSSDRAETFLFNLIRGSGADGLQALSWHRSLTANVSLVRPLLSISRSQTGEFCREMDLPIWQDSTNENLAYRRNRIRLELIPYLSQHFNPQVEQALVQTAELLSADVDYLEQQARALWQPDILPRIDRLKIQTLPLAMQRRVLRQFLNHYLPHDPSFAQVQKCLQLIDAPNRSRTDPFPGGAWAEVDRNWISIEIQE